MTVEFGSHLNYRQSFLKNSKLLKISTYCVNEKHDFETTIMSVSYKMCSANPHFGFFVFMYLWCSKTMQLMEHVKMLAVWIASKTFLFNNSNFEDP